MINRYSNIHISFKKLILYSRSPPSGYSGIVKSALPFCSGINCRSCIVIQKKYHFSFKNVFLESKSV